MFIADGCTSGLLYETMKAKYRLPGAIKPIEPLGIGATNSISAAMTSRENTYVSLNHKNKEAAVVVAAHGNGPKSSLPATSPQSMMSKNVPFVVAVPSQVPENMSPVQTTVAEIPQLNLLPSQEQSTATSCSWELSTGDGSSGSKRRTNIRSKRSKRTRLESVKFIHSHFFTKFHTIFVNVFLMCPIILK